MAKMGMNQNVSHFPSFFHKVCSIMVLDSGTSRPLGIQFCVGVICWCLLLLLFVTFSFSISCLALSHKMDPQAFWLHEGKLFMAKREVVNRGWLSDAQSSKKLKGQWKKASSLGMHLSAKYSGAREPTFADANIILPTVVFRKYRSMYMFTSVPTEWWNSPFKTHLQNCFRGWSMRNPRISKRGMAHILEMYALDEGLKALQKTGGVKDESNKRQRKE